MKNELLKLPPIAVRDSVRAPIVVLCRIDGNIHFFAFVLFIFAPTVFFFPLFSRSLRKSIVKTSKGHKAVLRLFGFLIQRKKWENPRRIYKVASLQTVGYKRGRANQLYL